MLQAEDCCPPLGGDPLSAEEAGNLAPLFKAIADPVRLRLLSLIACHPSGEACVCELTPAFGLTGPTISHHLKVLREAGILTSDRRATWIYYRVRLDMLERLSTVLNTAGVAAAGNSQPSAIANHAAAL